MAKRAAGEAAKGEAMMHEARKGDFLSRAGPSTVRTPRLNEKEFLADVLRPFHDAIVKALAPHFHDVFEGEVPDRSASCRRTCCRRCVSSTCSNLCGAGRQWPSLPR
jgi:hypothetical protein